MECSTCIRYIHNYAEIWISCALAEPNISTGSSSSGGDAQGLNRNLPVQRSSTLASLVAAGPSSTAATSSNVNVQSLAASAVFVRSHQQMSMSATTRHMLENLDRYSAYVLCRLGREIVQEIINKTSELFSFIRGFQVNRMYFLSYFF